MKAVYLEEQAVNRGDLSFSPITSLIETKVYENTTEEDKLEHIGDAEVVFSNKIIFDEAVFQKCPNLKYIGVCATGYNVIDTEAAKRHGVTVTNVPAYSTESVAQLAWGFILECAGKISLHNASVKEGEWIRSDSFCYWKAPVVELAEKNIGIVGYGSIGRRMAEMAAAFHMQVLVHTAHPEKYPEAPVQFVPLDTLLRESDVISLHCPLTPETEEMISRENIRKMKDGVILINVSRGGLIREEDLAEALRSGKISGAAVDVVSREPMEPENPLLQAPNITITPHLAWASIEARQRLIRQVADNLAAYLAGKPIHVV